MSLRFLSSVFSNIKLPFKLEILIINIFSPNSFSDCLIIVFPSPVHQVMSSSVTGPNELKYCFTNNFTASFSFNLYKLISGKYLLKEKYVCKLLFHPFLEIPRINKPWSHIKFIIGETFNLVFIAFLISLAVIPWSFKTFKINLEYFLYSSFDIPKYCA